MIKTLATFGGSDPLPVILGDKESGWSGAFGKDQLRWNSDGELDITPINWPEYQPRDTGFQGSVDGLFVLGSSQPGVILAGEIDKTGAVKSVEDTSGDYASRFAGYTQVDGGVFAALYADPVHLSPPKQECVYDLLFRQPGKPWYCTRVNYPSQYPLNPDDPKKSNIALSARAICCALWPNGRIGVYTEADSSGKVALMEIALVERPEDGVNTLVVVSHNENWLIRNPNADDPLSPCGEFAQLTVVEDKLNQRTLLAYQQYRDRAVKVSDTQTLFYGRWTIVEHRPGQPPKSLGMTDWWCLHRAKQKVIMVPMPNNEVYVGLPYDNLDTDGAKGWRFAVLSNGTFNVTEDGLPYGDVLSHSHDGAAVFFDRTPGIYTKQLIHVTP